MAKATIILNHDDVKSEIHPYLWYSFLETLGIDKDTEDIELCLSSSDNNKKIQE